MKVLIFAILEQILKLNGASYLERATSNLVWLIKSNYLLILFRQMKLPLELFFDILVLMIAAVQLDVVRLKLNA